MSQGIKKYLLLAQLFSRLNMHPESSENESLYDSVLAYADNIWDRELTSDEVEVLRTRVGSERHKMIEAVLNDLPQEKQELFRSGDIASAFAVIEAV